MCPTCLTVEAGDGAPVIKPHFNNKVRPSPAGVEVSVRKQVPAVVDATLKPGMDVTIARFWVCDGKYHLMVSDGRSKPPKRPLSGGDRCRLSTE